MEKPEFCATVEVLRGLEPGQLGLVSDFARLLTGPADATESEMAAGAVTAMKLSAVVQGSGAEWLRRFESTVFWAADGARSPAAWLDSHAECSKLRAGSTLKRARTLARLPIVEAAFSAGRLGDEKIRLACDHVLELIALRSRSQWRTNTRRVVANEDHRPSVVSPRCDQPADVPFTIGIVPFSPLSVVESLLDVDDHERGAVLPILHEKSLGPSFANSSREENGTM